MDVEKLIQSPGKWEREFTRALETAATVITTYGLRVLGATVIFFVGYFVARTVKRALVRAGRRAPHVDMTVITFVASLAKYAILSFTIVAMLSSFGVETTSVVAVLGAAGIAIGLALQGTLGHVASGFMLILFRPFRVGDAIETAGVAGTVTEVNLFTTEINSADNVRIIIPNSSVWSGVTKNTTTNRIRRIEFDVLIGYEDDVEKALKTVGDLIGGDTRILKDPAPVCGISKLADNGVRVLVQVWAATADVQPVQFALNKGIRDAFFAAGMSLPAPQRIPRQLVVPAPVMEPPKGA